jgi:hypothetical protein
LASGLTPTSSSRVESATPVHSQHISRPWVSCTVHFAWPPFQFCVLPEHSRKWMRETDGNRISSSMVKISGRSTRPWMISRCASGSIFGTPP